MPRDKLRALEKQIDREVEPFLKNQKEREVYRGGPKARKRTLGELWDRFKLATFVFIGVVVTTAVVFVLFPHGPALDVVPVRLDAFNLTQTPAEVRMDFVVTYTVENLNYVSLSSSDLPLVTLFRDTELDRQDKGEQDLSPRASLSQDYVITIFSQDASVVAKMDGEVQADGRVTMLMQSSPVWDKRAGINYGAGVSLSKLIQFDVV